MLGSYILRLVSVTARALAAPRLGPVDEVRLPMRIWLTDVDLYLHLNNGRYLTLMDFGRLACTLRSGLMQQMIRRRWIPVAGSAMVHFWRELRTLERVELVTRIGCWDEKWLLFEHRFEREGQVHALGAVRVVCKHQGRTVPPVELLRSVGYHGPPPAPHPSIVHWWEEQPARPAS